MRVLRSRNVNGLFYEGMHLLDECGERIPSRAGDTLAAPFPVMSVYEQPCERVLFDARRDANPFFHLMEGLWMLAGRYDVEYLDRYVKNFGQRYADDGVIHGAYGQRWRAAFGFDQLDHIVNTLRNDPTSRQCVLQMWDSTDKPEALAGWRGYNDLRGQWKDRPCNTHAYFRTRELIRPSDFPDLTKAWMVLDMTICCRSNDAIWGAHGANAVHFSMLQEYLAGRIGCQVGTLFQLSNNYHAYSTELSRIGDPVHLNGADPYDSAEVHPLAMANDWSKWDEDLAAFMRWHDALLWGDGEKDLGSYTNKWFTEVAERVAGARRAWTNAMKPSARKIAEAIAAPDWRRACLEWMDRRAR